MKILQAQKHNLHINWNPWLEAKSRLSVWQKASGIWKNRKSDPVKELKQIRKGWERKLPKLTI